jgi:hypothetical protein
MYNMRFYDTEKNKLIVKDDNMIFEFLELILVEL